MSKKRTSIHADVIRTLKRGPTELLAAFFEQKLADRIENPRPAALALAERVLTKPLEPVELNEQGVDEVLKLDITNDEIAALIAKAERFTSEMVPQILAESLDKSAAAVVRTLKRDWPEQIKWEADTSRLFRERLEDRWGKAFDLLRMMLTVAREMANERLKRQKRTKRYNEDAAAQLITRLHVRACQVTSEIVVLIENGFADGAMARWRTLHELTVIGLLIQEHGSSLADRYIAHEHVETKRAMDRLLLCHEELNYPAPSQADVAAVEVAYQGVLDIYGQKFGQQYGWARHHLGHPKPTFRDLEKAAGKAAMSVNYQFAGYNVHATPKGIISQIGALGDRGVLLAGASNAGFVQPTVNAAAALGLMTSLRYGHPWRYDDLLELKTLMILRDAIPARLHRADRQLRRDHTAELKRRQMSRTPRPPLSVKAPRS